MPQRRWAGRRGVVAVGGSAGGVEALVAVAAGLPADLPACVLVTVHIGAHAHSTLPNILSRSGPLPASHPKEGERLRPGRIYVAPPGFHLLAGNGQARLSAGPRVNRHRPAIDVMFASAARWAGVQTVAVVLSGLLDDGAVGAALVARSGGRVLVQDPAEALFDSMPRSALSAAPQARACQAADIGKTIGAVLAQQPTLDDAEDEMVSETHMEDSGDPQFLDETAGETQLTRLTCPDCGGVLAQIELPHITYYRCHVGHHYGPRTLAAAQAENAERKLWAAVAALEDHATLARHLADHAAPGGEGADLKEAAARAATLVEAVRFQARPPADQEERG